MNYYFSKLCALVLAHLAVLSFSLSAQEVCNNGVDDDGDGFIDCNDSECNNSLDIFPVSEEFENQLFQNPNWVLSGSAYLNSGWLTLTDDSPFLSGNAILNAPFSSSDNIIVEFEYSTAILNNNNNCVDIGDGLTFFLIDGTAPPSVGGSGGALGYTSNSLNPSGGITGGFVGVGLDEFGNFAVASLTSSINCTPLGKDAVTIRGMQTNDALTAYRCIATSLLPNNANIDVGSRAEARKVRVVISNGGLLDLFMDLNTGQGFEPIFVGLDLNQVVPPTFKIGFAASTGGACIAHEINNVFVGKPVNLELSLNARSDTIDVCIENVELEIMAVNHGPNNVSNVLLESIIPAEISDVTWTCADCDIQSGNGNDISTTISLDVGETITIEVQGSVADLGLNGFVNYSARIDFNCTGYLSTNINSSQAVDSLLLQNTFDIDPFGNDTTICDDTTLTLNATTPQATGYLWNDGSSNPTLTVALDGNYWVEVTKGACVETDTINVNVDSSAIVAINVLCGDNGQYQIQLDINNQSFEVLVNDVAGTGSYANNIWTSDLIANELHPIVVVSTIGCEEQAISYTVNCMLLTISLPTAFTPNNDGENDLLLGYASENLQLDSYTLSIYDRWGTLLFESNDINQGWDGTFKSKKMSAGVYTAILKVKMDGLEKKTISQVKLIK